MGCCKKFRAVTAFGLRTPNAGNGNNVRNVNPTGNLNNNNANNSNGVAPDWVEIVRSSTYVTKLNTHARNNYPGRKR